LKEVIGFVLNKIDAEELDRDLFLAKILSLFNYPFSLSRYRGLKVSDFSDNLTTVNPNELLFGANAGGGAGMEGGLQNEMQA